MSKMKTGVVVAATLCLGVLQAAEPDPKLGRSVYFGSASVERASEFAEVHLQFQVRCKTSPKEVRDAIAAVADGYSNTIAKKVPLTAVSETDRPFVSPVQVSDPEPGAYVENIGGGIKPVPLGGFQPDVAPVEPIVAPGPKREAKRIDACTGLPVALNAKVPSTFSGTLKLGVRSKDIGWVEGLSREYQKLPTKAKAGDVWVTPTSVVYDAVPATHQAMTDELLKAARENALEANSEFRLDDKELHFVSSHVVSRRKETRVQQTPKAIPGSALEKGKAPKVKLTLPLVYTVYVESPDLSKADGGATKGRTETYEVEGSKEVDAEFAKTSATVSATCYPSNDAALKAIEEISGKVKGDLETFNGRVPRTEKERFTDNEPSTGDANEYVAVAKNEKSVVTKYLDGCTGNVVDAPADGSTKGLPKYFRASRTYELRTARYAALLTKLEAWRDTYVKATDDKKAVVVSFTPAVADVTDATERAMLRSARTDANSCLLTTTGPLGGEIAANKFTCAHVTNIRVGNTRPNAESAMLQHAPRGPGFGGAAFDVAPAPPEIPVTPVVKPGDQRVWLKKEATFAFDVEFTTANLVGKLKAPAVPAKPPVAPLVPKIKLGSNLP